MRIAFLTSGRLVPSSRFRVLAFVPHLQGLGHECLVLPSRPEKYASWPLLGFRLSGYVKRWHRQQDLAELKRWSPDVVVLERELFSDATFDVEQSLRQTCKRLVLDIDDGLFVLNRHKFEVLCGLSDHIIAGNELLAVRAKSINSRVTIIPTCVDLDRYECERLTSDFKSQSSNSGASKNSNSKPDDPARPLVLGWTGTAANIEYLEVLRQPLRQLAREFPVELRVIAESDQHLKQLQLESEGVTTRFIKWSEADEIKELNNFDVGLMPMPDTDWTRYKCGLKILQYMALGIPSVASPVGVNSEIIRHGNTGWLATTPDEWTFLLRQLISDRAMRMSVIEAARRTVEERYSVAAQLPRLDACLKAVFNGL